MQALTRGGFGQPAPELQAVGARRGLFFAVRSLRHSQDSFLLKAPGTAAVLAPELCSALGLRLQEKLPLAEAVGTAALWQQARRLRAQALPALGALTGPRRSLLWGVGARHEMLLLFLHQLQEDVGCA